MHNLAKNILATVCYYDVLDYPLTSFEIWKYLMKFGHEADDREYSLEDVSDELEGGSLKRFIKEFQGFYFLKSGRDLPESRLKRNRISMVKIKGLRRVVWFMRFIPFVCMVGITGRLAMKNAQVKSDWDLLVAIKYGRLWIGRTLVTLVTHFLGKRRHGHKIKDRVCLNHFITDKSLKIRIRDLFSANEYYFYFPLFDDNIHRRFQLKNKWIRNFKPNYKIAAGHNLKIIEDTDFSRRVRNFLEKIFDWDFLENWMRILETKKIKNNPKTHQRGSYIDVSEEALIFLPNPQGPKVFENFKRKVSEL